MEEGISEERSLLGWVSWILRLREGDAGTCASIRFGGLLESLHTLLGLPC